MRKFFTCLIFLTLFSLTGCFDKKEEMENEQNQPQQPSKVLDYLSLSAHFLINQQNANGFFKYEYDFITGNYTNLDNVIHQTRAGYTLIQYYTFLIRNNIDSSLSSLVLESAYNAVQGFESASVSQNSMPGKLISFYYNKNSVSPVRSRRQKGDSLSLQRLKAEIAATAFALMTELQYWNATNDESFKEIRQEWKTALVYHAKQSFGQPAERNPFMPYIWQALGLYAQAYPNDRDVQELLPEIDSYFLMFPRKMDNVEDYTWDMIATNQRYQRTKDVSFANYAIRQTKKLLENMYTQHDTTTNNCSLALGLVESSLVLMGKDGDYARIEQTALGRSQLEYYSSLKYTLLPNQTWIMLGPGRTLHSKDFQRFTGANIESMHKPRTNIGLIGTCMLAGMRFSNEDLKELQEKQK